MSAEFSKIGSWSEAKLEIVRKYGLPYSQIMTKNGRFSHAYIDAFAGSGTHISKTSDRKIQGSPIQALEIAPPFKDYFFIDTDAQKVGELRKNVGERSDVHIYEGDCNQLLLEQIFSQIKYEDYRRALCLLDPYGLHLDWEVIFKAGKMRSIEIFLNFPMLDINRNALRLDIMKADPSHIERMNRFWGDDSWKTIVYESYGNEESSFQIKRRASYSALVEAFRQRLTHVAGFEYVPEPVVMRALGFKGPILYYLFFASPNKTANKIVQDIFDKYRAKDHDTLF